uniref:phytohormone-binding protein CSBP-like n=1 Tax=Erigeron canadensis TaxID=72917 RepID=UPI001CB8E88F|nr:phytohormone-binding protein CSBP-like [Erigeron canadensis]
MKEDKAQVKVAVPIRDLWKAMSSDFQHMIPKILPAIVEEVELIEGDGGYGSIFLFKFGPAVPKISYQKEKIVELDESLRQMALEVVEGGNLDHGYSSYTTHVKLTEVGKAETLVGVKVVYETKTEAEDTHMPGDTLKPSLHYFKCLENHMSNGL